jgi:hypothetical protein
MVKPLDRRTYLCFPIISFVVSLIIILITGILSVFTSVGIPGLTTRLLFLILTVVFTALTIAGQLDSSLFGSKVGLSFAKFLHLADKDKLDPNSNNFDLNYKTNMRAV